MVVFMGMAYQGCFPCGDFGRALPNYASWAKGLVTCLSDGDLGLYLFSKFLLVTDLYRYL